MDIFSPTFGREVKSRLAYLEMSQTDLAKLVGKTQTYINDIINGKRNAADIRRKIISTLDDLESRCPVEK